MYVRVCVCLQNGTVLLFSYLFNINELLLSARIHVLFGGIVGADARLILLMAILVDSLSLPLSDVVSLSIDKNETKQGINVNE